MNWVYIIKSIRHRRIYIGQTRNLVKRLSVLKRCGVWIIGLARFSSQIIMKRQAWFTCVKDARKAPFFGCFEYI